MRRVGAATNYTERAGLNKNILVLEKKSYFLCRCKDRRSQHYFLVKYRPVSIATHLSNAGEKTNARKDQPA